MAEAILSGMIAGGFEPSDLLVRDIDVRKLKSLEERYGVRAAADDSFFEEAGAIILAVKPQVMAGILSENKERIRKDHLLISIAAGITLKDLKQHVPTDKIVRVMPNTPALIKKGISALCSFKQLEKGEQDLVEKIFSSIGEFLWLDEGQFNGVTAVSGSGPAYVYRFADALIDSGVLIGLPRDLARTLVVETIIGSAEMIRTTGESPKELEAKVTSPGGTTIHGLMAMEQGGFSSAVKDGVQAAWRRAAELGQDKK